MKLHVFDFDNTLFSSPEPPSWFKAYWYGSKWSLNPPCVPKEPDESWWITEAMEAAREAIADPDVVAILLTGREEKDANFAKRVPELLAQQELEFDAVRLRTERDSKRWKLKQMLEFGEDAEVIHLWDDRQEHLDFFIEELENLGLKVVPHLIVEEPKRCESYKFGSVIKYRGAFYVKV